MTHEDAIALGATHTSGNSFYMHEKLHDDEKGEWYRWDSKRTYWVEILRKPKNAKPL